MILREVKTLKTIFKMNPNSKEKYIKIGSVRFGFYLVMDTESFRVCEEQDSTVCYPIVDIQGLKII